MFFYYDKTAGTFVMCIIGCCSCFRTRLLSVYYTLCTYFGVLTMFIPLHIWLKSVSSFHHTKPILQCKILAHIHMLVQTKLALSPNITCLHLSHAFAVDVFSPYNSLDASH